MTPSRTGDMDAPRAAFGAGLAGPLYLIHTNKVPTPLASPFLGLFGKGKNHAKGGSDGTARP